MVHGHTPTVSVDEFHGATRGKSTVVSYLAESSDRVQVPEVASQIRVYNIDEGMSPVYYVGDEEANDPSRIPLGLRVASDESRLAPVISHSKSDRVLSIDNNRDVTKDTRKLWKWKSGQNRCALTSGWHRVSNSRWIEALSFNGIEWLLETSEEGKEIFSRRVSGYDIERNVLLQLLEDANCRPSGISIAKHKPALFHLNHKGGPKHLAALQNGGESWRIAKGLQIAAIGFMLSGKKNILEVFIINGCNKREFNFTVAGETPVKHPVKALTIERLRISLSGKPVAIHDSRVKDVVDQMKRWMGSEEIKKSKQFPIIAHYPLESATASKFKIESIGKSWNFPKPKKVRKKKKSPKSESSKTTPPVIKPEPSKSESPKTTPSVIKQEPSKSESPKTTRPKAPPNMENYKPTAKSTKDTVPPYPPLNVDIEGAEKGGKSGSKKQSSASSSASSSEKPKQPEPKSPTIDSAIQVELKFNSQRGFEFDIGTEDLRKMIGKKLPAKSSLELKAYRINSRAPIINIETLQNNMKWTFQLKVEGNSFKQNGTPKAQRRHQGINANEAIAIFEHPEFIRLVEMGIKGDSD